MSSRVLHLFEPSDPRAHDMSLIEPGLYISNIDTASNKELNEKLNITHILTVEMLPVAKEYHPNTLHKYLWIKAHDVESEDLISKFSQANQFIAAAQLNGGNVIVHCVAGRSRSATLVIAYIMKKYSWSADKALKYVESKRDVVYPNTGFLSQLRLYESMGWGLDPTNAAYRKLILNWLRTKIKYSEWKNGRDPEAGGPPRELINEYMVKLRSLDGDPGQIISACDAANTPAHHHRLNQTASAIYKCKNCRLFLFRDLNVIANAGVSATNMLNNHDEQGNRSSAPGLSPVEILISQDEKPCGNIYIEPQDWMMGSVVGQDAGNLNCKNCAAKLGAWNWKGFWCGCPLHDQLLSLMIKIDAKKVDRHVYRSANFASSAPTYGQQ